MEDKLNFISASLADNFNLYAELKQSKYVINSINPVYNNMYNSSAIIKFKNGSFIQLWLHD